jgi:hypothetical protein
VKRNFFPKIEVIFCNNSISWNRKLRIEALLDLGYLGTFYE